MHTFKINTSTYKYMTHWGFADILIKINWLVFSNECTIDHQPKVQPIEVAYLLFAHIELVEFW